MDASAYSGGSRQSDLSRHFDGLDGCFILHDLRTNKDVLHFGGERCREQLAPCSTFKWPLALIGFDTGVLKDIDEVIKWDGMKHSIQSWNADQTASSWVKNSVVWVSQRISPAVGLNRMQTYLSDFRYGNQDLSRGLTSAWLTDPPNATLKISAEEQISFLKLFWRGELKASARSYDLTKAVMLLETTPRGFTLHGKTGSGFSGVDRKLRLGWFIAHLQRGAEQYIAVSTFTDRQRRTGAQLYAGPEARDIMSKILVEQGFW